jgi:TolA-binding protein
MKFDSLIRKSYFLLEQDEQIGQQPPAGGAPAPAGGGGDAKEAAAGLDKLGKKLGDQVESAEDQLFKMSRDLVRVVNQAMQTDRIQLDDHPNLKQILDKLNSASGIADARAGLPAIQKVIKDYSEDTAKKEQPFNF